MFDLDPSQELPWSAVVVAARELKARIEDLGLVPFARLTGGKGLHLVVPVQPGPAWPAVKKFTRTVVDAAAVPAVEEVPEVSHTETVIDSPEVAPWDEQVLVSEATPAGEPCPPTVETAVLGEATTSNPASVPAQTQSLAHTGSDLVVPLGAGLVLVVVGGALVAAGLRREV